MFPMRAQVPGGDDPPGTLGCVGGSLSFSAGLSSVAPRTQVQEGPCRVAEPALTSWY